MSKTLSPLAELLQSGAANTAATAGLAAAPVGTPEHAAAQVLTTASHADLTGALDAVTTIANTAATLSNSGTTTLPATAPEISQLSHTALVTSILGNVDVIKLANIAGQAQEIAWTAAAKLFPPPGVLPDPVGDAAQTAALIPLGLELASVGANMLTGKAGNTDPALLGTQANPVGNAITTQAQTLDLAALAVSVSTMARSQGAGELAAVVGEGLNAASFFASGAHQSNQNLVVDNAGRNAVQWIADWLNLQITRAV